MSIVALAGTVAGLLAIVNALPRALAGLWPFGLITGIVGLAQALAELGAIARHEQPAAGRKLARIAVAVSIAHGAFIGLFFLTIFAIGNLQGLAGRR